jgi:predicted heme/steroid binding protein|tara:strand:+ start:180 stop:1007 length:828 start_codon:yes stop_codon:yes gene_type:complete|eukprot:30939-Pelagococcus_subviridis.AAC.3
MSATRYTRDEVAKHNTAESNWIIIDDKVYDVTKFARFHPGGKAFVDASAGSDATKNFYAFHRQDVLKSMASKYLIGTLVDAPSAKKASVTLKPGELSKVPYAESGAFQGLPSSFYDESHHRFRADLRKFFDERVVPDAAANDAAGKPPPHELWKEMGKRGMLAMRIQNGPWLEDLVQNCGVVLPGGITPKQFDCFHELIAHEEFCRLGVPGYCDGLGAGFVIGIPPVLQFGNPELARKVGREVLLGEKRIALAISGPEAGSDVAGLTCVAKKARL